MSLIEITVAMACSLVLMLGLGTLATESVRHSLHARGKIDSIQQNTEIKDLLFNMASPGDCKDKLGITTFAPNANGEVDLAPATFQLDNASSTIGRIYFAQSTFLRSTNATREFSVQLKINQTLKRGLASAGTTETALAPVALGLMSVTVDNANTVVSCNWDSTEINPMTVCAGTDGVRSTSDECHTRPSREILTACPTGSSLVDGSCITSNANCWNQSLADDFDGYKFDCQYIPPAYTVRYPANYTPPQPPGGTITTPSSGASIAPPPPPTASVVPCECGGQTIPPDSTTQFCIFKTTEDDSFFGNGSAYDDMWEVKKCNAAGKLEAHAQHPWVFNEEGSGTRHEWRVGACQLSGGSKNDDGRRYSLGRCY